LETAGICSMWADDLDAFLEVGAVCRFDDTHVLYSLHA
jgi:hypothetical protein